MQLILLLGSIKSTQTPPPGNDLGVVVKMWNWTFLFCNSHSIASKSLGRQSPIPQFPNPKDKKEYHESTKGQKHEKEAIFFTVSTILTISTGV